MFISEEVLTPDMGVGICVNYFIHSLGMFNANWFYTSVLTSTTPAILFSSGDEQHVLRLTKLLTLVYVTLGLFEFTLAGWIF